MGVSVAVEVSVGSVVVGVESFCPSVVVAVEVSVVVASAMGMSFETTNDPRRLTSEIANGTSESRTLVVVASGELTFKIGIELPAGGVEVAPTSFCIGFVLESVEVGAI